MPCLYVCVDLLSTLLRSEEYAGERQLYFHHRPDPTKWIAGTRALQGYNRVDSAVQVDSLFLRETGGAVTTPLRSAEAGLNTKMKALAVDAENGNDADALIDSIMEFDDQSGILQSLLS
jgi:hypothetical protein